MSTISTIEGHLKDLKSRFRELDEQLVPRRDGVVDVRISAAMSKVEQRIKRLEPLHSRAIAGDVVNSAEIDEALGKIQPVVTLPRNLASDSEIDEAQRKFKALQDAPDPMSPEERARLNEIEDRIRDGAIAHIERQFLGLRKLAGEEVNSPVSYTQGLHFALITMMASMQIRLDTAVQFNREQRLKLVDEVKALRERVHALESAPRLKYQGVYKEGQRYAVGDVVTHHGSMFHCNLETTGEPEKTYAWTLAVKRGRDGKDAQ